MKWEFDGVSIWTCPEIPDAKIEGKFAEDGWPKYHARRAMPSGKLLYQQFTYMSKAKKWCQASKKATPGGLF